MNGETIAFIKALQNTSIEKLRSSGGNSDAGKVVVVDENGNMKTVTLPVGQGEIGLDSSLSVSGAAADAKVVGDAITSLNGSLDEQMRMASAELTLDLEWRRKSIASASGIETDSTIMCASKAIRLYKGQTINVDYTDQPYWLCGTNTEGTYTVIKAPWQSADQSIALDDTYDVRFCTRKADRSEITTDEVNLVVSVTTPTAQALEDIRDDIDSAENVQGYDSETLTNQVHITGEKTLLNLTWENIGINTSTGVETASTTVCTSKKVRFYKGQKLIINPNGQRYYVHGWATDDGTYTNIRSLTVGSTITEYTFAADYDVRITVRFADGTTITPSDVVLAAYVVTPTAQDITNLQDDISLIHAIAVTPDVTWENIVYSTAYAIHQMSATVCSCSFHARKGDKITVTPDGTQKYYVFAFDSTGAMIELQSAWKSLKTEMVLAGDYTVEVGCMNIDNSNILPENVTLDISVESDIATALNQSMYGVPVLELEGDISTMSKDNAVTLNYKLFGQTGTCTCKWQGSSSLRYPKKNYTIKLNTAMDAWNQWATYVNTLRSANGNISNIPTTSRWGSQKKYCFKANWIDASHMRNVVLARIWGQMVADRISDGQVTDGRTEAPNYGAIDGFPVEIQINGESVGLYTMNIPKDAWTFAMGESETEYAVSCESNAYSSGKWTALANLDGTDYDVEYAMDGVETDTIKTSLNTAIQAAIDAGSDWETTMANYIDVGSVIDYFIFACMFNLTDAMAHNIIYGTYDGMKWFMSAYDLDTSFGIDAYGSAVCTLEGRCTFAGAKNHRLGYLALTHSLDKFKARYTELRAGILSELNVWKELTTFASFISQHNYSLDQKLWPNMPSTAIHNIAQYMDYWRIHVAALDSEIERM